MVPKLQKQILEENQWYHACDDISIISYYHDIGNHIVIIDIMIILHITN